MPPGTFYGWVRRGVVPAWRIGGRGGRRLVVTGLGQRLGLESIRRLVENEEVNYGQSTRPAEE
jgi:hypothetical protein